MSSPPSTSNATARRKYDVVFYSPWATALVDRGAALPTGGAEVQLLMVARGLAARGHRIALVVRGRPERLPGKVDGISIITETPATRKIRFVSGLVALARSARVLLAARAGTYVQRGAGSVTGVVRLASRLAGARFVYSSASVIDFEYERLESARRHVKLYELGVRGADEIVVQTDEQAVLCGERFGRSPWVVPSIAEQQAPRSEVPDAFLWVGRAARYRRAGSYLELARRLPEARFRMILVPSGPDGRENAAEIESEAAGLPNVELLAPRPREQVGALLASAVAVVNTGDFEGLSNVFLEGWARGVPGLALSHDPDGLIESEGLGGFAHGSLDRFVELAKELWATRTDQAQIAARCREYVTRRHAPDRVIDRWSEVLGLPARAPVEDGLTAGHLPPTRGVAGN